MAATVRLWREAEGHWRWAFEDGDLAIASNHPYATRRAAVEAAGTSYPGVPIEEAGSAASGEGGRVGLLACVLMTLAIWRHYRPGRVPSASVPGATSRGSISARRRKSRSRSR
jgi:hypothetical protein